MADNYDSIDLKWTSSGDLVIEDGDLADTSEDTLMSLVQEIQTVVKSSLYDWELYPGIGAGLDDFVGEANVKETSNRIHDRLKACIAALGVVNEKDISIGILPVHRHELLIILRIGALSTAYNRLKNNQLLVIQFIFNYMEKGVFFLQEPPQLTADI